MFQSIVQERGRVFFPRFMAERHYMIPFMQRDGLPEGLKPWQKTVDEMLAGIETDEPIYFMADQDILEPGQYHRRPGIHIEGYWDPVISAHGGGHRSYPAWRSVPTHRSTPRHKASRITPVSWSEASFEHPETTLLASNVTACRAFAGSYDGVIGEMGDCANIDVSRLSEVVMEAGKVYAGNVSMLHETIPVDSHCTRTVVRLTLPGVTIQ